MLHKDHDRKDLVVIKKKNTCREPKGAWRQDEMIGGKSPIVK
jgi:hypothetical protein